MYCFSVFLKFYIKMKCRKYIGFVILSIFVLVVFKQFLYTYNVVHNQRNTFNFLEIRGTLQQNYLNISELDILHLKSRKLGNTLSRHKTEFVTYQDESKFRKEISRIQYGKEREDKALLVNTWLCVELNANKKELVVYSQSRPSLKWVPGRFQVKLKHGRPSNSFDLKVNRTAYFLRKRNLFANLHHFFNDFAIVFFAIQRNFHPFEKQSVFYNVSGYSNQSTFMQLYEALHLRDDQYHFDFNLLPHGTCYQQSVFADGVHSPWRLKKKRRHHYFNEEVKPLLQHIKSYFNISSEECSGTVFPKIVLIDRISRRQVVNVKRIVSELKHSGYNNTEVVYLEEKRLKDQIELILCVDVLIGVQGAGLQWASFMKPGSSLIEIAWPTRGWHFFYADHDFAADHFPQVRIFQLEVPAKDVIFNQTFVEEVLDVLNAKTGRPIVPVSELVTLVTKATSGASSEALWERFTIGKYENKISRLP